MTRIISFLPSSTEILYELGLGDQIVGVIHECKFPEDAKTKPRIINSSFEAAKLSSAEIDMRIVELAQTGGVVLLSSVRLSTSSQLLHLRHVLPNWITSFNLSI